MIQKPLSGIRVVEIQGIGPAPFCGMMLADMGAEVIIVERADGGGGDVANMGTKDITKRGKKSVALDLKNPSAIEAVLKLVETSDALIEGMRPGVMERLGLGPDVCHARNPKLVYGRMTGWGQTGPLAKKAGHDINYISLVGANSMAGHAGETPFAPPTLVGDLGGGAMYLLSGLLAAIISANATGKGQVVDAAIVDGSASMMNLLLSTEAAIGLPLERGKHILNGPHWYDTYKCADGNYVTLGALEVKFYKGLVDVLGLSDDSDFADQFNPALWPAQKIKLTEIMARKTRAEWVAHFEDADVCFGPLYSVKEAMDDSHVQARGIYYEQDGVVQAAPAPRFSNAPNDLPDSPVKSGAHSEEILGSLGLSAEDINLLTGK